MSTVWNKLDAGLCSIYSKYRRSRESGSADAAASAIERVNVSLYYSGDLAGIEALGFETAATGPAGFANGTLDLANLEQLAAHPSVVKISFGESRPLTLDVSVPNIRANEIWNRSGETFTGLTGKGVIIGIIDTGIDIHHPFFFTTTEPKRPRIFRIWDQGLEPQGVDKSPDANLLSGGATYGVEYDQGRIVAGLGGVGDFRHRDTHGHGTHVASIAAGNGQDKFKFIGVAPEADLIIVKHADLEKIPQVGGVEVSKEKLFRDAVAYILNVTKNVFDNRPVVINASLGNQIGPHDGLTADEDFLTATFDGVPGRCFVAGVGNDGASAQHASINFGPGGGQVVLPMYLFDEQTNSETYIQEIRLYYPLTVNAVTVQLKLPGESAIAGPALGNPPVGPINFAGGRTYEMSHSIDSDPLVFTNRGLVIRSRFILTLRPNDRGFHVANRFYFLTIGATEQVVVHMWCSNTGTKQGFQIGGYGSVRTAPSPPVSGTTLVLDAGQGWKFPDLADGEFHVDIFAVGNPSVFETMRVTGRSMDTLTVVRAQQGTSVRAIQSGDNVALHLPTGVSAVDAHQIRDPASAANVIGVAGYNAENSSLPLYFGSSRGPLATYTIPQGLQQPDKPDIAAPAVGVDAARSQGRIKLSKKRRPTESKTGTSMAAPHVTGTVALMLQKKPQLTTQDITNLLKTNVRTVSAPVTPLTADEAGAGRLDSKKTLNNTT